MISRKLYLDEEDWASIAGTIAFITLYGIFSCFNIFERNLVKFVIGMSSIYIIRLLGSLIMSDYIEIMLLDLFIAIGMAITINIESVKALCLLLVLAIINIVGIGVYYRDSEWNNHQETVYTIKAIGLKVAVYISCISFIYTFNTVSRKIFALLKQKESQVKKTQVILGYLLPPFVRGHSKEGVNYISEKMDFVSIVFCDIYHFDEICMSYSANELSELLDNLFH